MVASCAWSIRKSGRVCLALSLANLETWFYYVRNTERPEFSTGLLWCPVAPAAALHFLLQVTLDTRCPSPPPLTEIRVAANLQEARPPPWRTRTVLHCPLPQEAELKSCIKVPLPPLNSDPRSESALGLHFK